MRPRSSITANEALPPRPRRNRAAARTRSGHGWASDPLGFPFAAEATEGTATGIAIASAAAIRVRRTRMTRILARRASPGGAALGGEPLEVVPAAAVAGGAADDPDGRWVGLDR